jgi:hypothetical protein
MIIHNDILRTIPKKKEPNMKVALQMEDPDRFSKYFTDRIRGD